MNAYFEQVFSLLTTTPGNLVYHIVLVFSVIGAIIAIARSKPSEDSPQWKRALIGLSVLLGLQVFLFIVSSLDWMGIIHSETFLPPLDRCISLLAIIWIAWVWVFPEAIKMADLATFILNLLGMTALALTLVYGSLNQGNSFNLSYYESAWQAFSIVVILLAGVGLVLRRPIGWSYGLAMLILAFIGHLVTFIFPMNGNFPGFVRLTQIAMYPLLVALSIRFTPGMPRVKGKTGKSTKEVEEPVQEPHPLGTDARTFEALMELAAESDPGRMAQALTRGIAHSMLADLCFLIMVSEENKLVIACGYDLIREEYLGSTDLDPEKVPLLASAIHRGRSLRLPASSTSPDMKNLGEILNLKNPGHILNVPIAATRHDPMGSILVLSPYSNRTWTAVDQKYLSNVSPLFLSILERGEKVAKLEDERDQALLEAQKASAQEFAAGNLTDQESEIYSGSGREAESILSSVLSAGGESKTPGKGRGNGRKQLTEDQVGAVNQQLEQELQQSLEEVARMQNQVGKANLKILELEKRPSASISNEQIEVIASVSQELRQPMSSIVGYTDLLMGESMGHLSELQRKFIERIKASTERIGGLVDDLIQITNLDAGKVKFKPEPIDLNLVVDNAMAYTSTQLREKNITLRLDILEKAPPILVDREALQQILIHLLQNATAATHPEGNITLRMRLEKKDGNDLFNIQVVDNGGGIGAEDIARVFARRYRAETTLIPGVGDTGVGLSIARTLVEAQNGRIWVETEQGTGSTFFAQIPVTILKGK
jgi:signal transduction histidine kinase